MDGAARQVSHLYQANFSWVRDCSLHPPGLKRMPVLRFCSNSLAIDEQSFDRTTLFKVTNSYSSAVHALSFISEDNS
jgi:hypothetical protein